MGLTLGNSARILGILTIGQSPRDDVVPALRAFLPENIQILQLGAIDHLSDAEAKALTPVNDRDGIETRLRSGESVIVSKTGLAVPLGAAARRLSGEVSTILFLCSSSFPVLASIPGIIRPNELILPVMRHAASGQRLGVIGPESDLPRQPEFWHPYAPGAIFAAGSPVDPFDHLADAGSELVRAGATMLFLDCMGFREDQRLAVRVATDVPVFAATTLVGRLLPEFL